MTIPKKIHYCWFGGKDLPELAIRCMASWKKYCPDYEIIRWDERNSDLETCRFVREAYAAKKWAFVSDYMRLKVVEEHGGIYLDIDVELLKPLDQFLDCQGFMGFEQAKPYCVNSGLGFGAVAHHPVIQKLMGNYEKISFVKPDGNFDMTPCTERDTVVLIQMGLIQNNKKQIINGIEVFPFEYFSPLSFHGDKYFTSETATIHHFNASWHSPKSQYEIKLKRRLAGYLGVRIGGLVGNFILLCKFTIEDGVLVVINKIARSFLR